MERNGTMNGHRLASGERFRSLEVQHLKTFTTKVNAALPRMHDALDRMLQQTPMFVHNYRLDFIEERSMDFLVVLDPWLGHQEVERFAVKSIRAPRYRMHSAKKEYNNLILFRIDANSLPEGGPETNELHIFQVLSVPAKELVEYLVALGADPDYSLSDCTTTITTMPCTRRLSARVTQSSRKDPGEVITVTTTKTINAARPVKVSRERSPSPKAEVQKLEEISTDLINAEVMLLNHSFDDIEQAMQLLREKSLKTRRKSSVLMSVSSSSKLRGRSGSKSTIVSELLTKDKDFKSTVLDLFAKIKFVSILLSRLGDYVKVPRTSVLVGQLYTILGEAVDYCRQPKTGRPDIPQSVSQPRFPKYTLLFLEANLTSEQDRTLKELGALWTTPREEKDEENVYIPVFRNGFVVDPNAYDASLFRYKDPSTDLRPEKGRSSATMTGIHTYGPCAFLFLLSVEPDENLIPKQFSPRHHFQRSPFHPCDNPADKAARKLWKNLNYTGLHTVVTQKRTILELVQPSGSKALASEYFCQRVGSGK
ncbi:unnamed protein product [Calicophoron daubneyi]|uniref:EPS8 spectrin-like domain-containing protein n=1 Tax=Calicophoron daubneyi TaxID=300641 RepID=A0AAV2T4C8_CALDB